MSPWKKYLLIDFAILLGFVGFILAALFLHGCSSFYHDDEQKVEAVPAAPAKTPKLYRNQVMDMLESCKKNDGFDYMNFPPKFDYFCNNRARFRVTAPLANKNKTAKQARR